MNSLHLSLTLTQRILKFSPPEPSHLFHIMLPAPAAPFFLSFSLYFPLLCLTFLLSFYLSQALYFDFSIRPHLCPSITVRSFTGSQGALYPPDTMPPIHITSRDTDTNFLKGTQGCTTPWSRWWRENWDRWTETWEKAGKRDWWGRFKL